jgi:hypothetical protein
MDPILIIVSILFVLSLLGATVLFKFFKSSAIIKNKKYQAGGAIAGFILIFGVLYTTYANIEAKKYEDLVQQNKQLKNKYDLLKTNYDEQMNKKLQIKGRINPFHSGYTRIILTGNEVNPDSDGKFSLEAPCLDPKDGAYLYVVREGKSTISKIIFPEDNTNDLIIPDNG